MLTTIALIVLALLVGLFLFGCFWALLGELLAARDSRRWPSVSARIENSRLVRNYDCNRMPGYHCRIRYEFTIGEQVYVGDTITFGGFRYFTRRVAESLHQCYCVGASVMVFYKPDDPELSVLRPGFTTKDDLSAFNLYHHRHSPTARRQYLRSWFLPACIWLLVCSGIWYLADRARGTPMRTFLDLIPLFSGLPLYLLYFPWAYRRKLRKIVAGMVSEGQNRGLFCRQRVTTSVEGVTNSGEFGQTSTAWRAVERVVAADEHAYIYTNALAAIIVPRRAFAGPAEFEEFVRAARGHLEKAVA